MTNGFTGLLDSRTKYELRHNRFSWQMSVGSVKTRLKTMRRLFFMFEMNHVESLETHQEL